MGDGVVNVQQIQILIRSHLCHLGRQSQSIRRMLKERIVEHLHFMEMNQLTRNVQLDGYGVADEMDLVAEGSQFLAHLCRHHSTSAIGWITGDSDFHQINSTFSGQKRYGVMN